YVDESAFCLSPEVARTCALTGQTFLLRLPLSPAHLSAINGITQDGQLFLRPQDRAYRSADVAAFMRCLVCCVRGKLLVIWDGPSLPRGQPIQEYLKPAVSGDCGRSACQGPCPS